MDRIYLRPDGTVNMDSNYIPQEDMDIMTKKHSEQPTSQLGTPGEVSVVGEFGTKDFRKTVIAFDGDLGAIAGGADLALGALIYTFPAGVIRVNSVKANFSLQQKDGKVTADTPEVGIGSTVGTGVTDTLATTTDNILAGVAITDCDGTVEKRVASSTHTVLEDAAHTVFFNVADGWAADGDAALGFTGEVVITWEIL